MNEAAFLCCLIMTFDLFSDGRGNGLKMASIHHAKILQTAWTRSGGNPNSHMCRCHRKVTLS